MQPVLCKTFLSHTKLWVATQEVENISLGETKPPYAVIMLTISKRICCRRRPALIGRRPRH